MLFRHFQENGRTSRVKLLVGNQEKSFLAEETLTFTLNILKRITCIGNKVRFVLLRKDFRAIVFWLIASLHINKK